MIVRGSVQNQSVEREKGVTDQSGVPLDGVGDMVRATEGSHINAFDTKKKLPDHQHQETQRILEIGWGCT